MTALAPLWGLSQCSCSGKKADDAGRYDDQTEDPCDHVATYLLTQNTNSE
jgi:hypothetical protein